ncbi:hypothetical protein FACS1894109_17440 [Spirochaetia bacterium]|nr:hypothetical protein FACS1894109_17440 [Spirochaetia bacterium]
MKNFFKLFGIATLVVVIGFVFTACDNMAELTVKNDGSRTYYVQVTINGETRRELSELPKGDGGTYSSTSGIEYTVRYSKTSFWNPLLGLYSRGTIDAGDSYTINISDFEDQIF